MKKLSVVLLLVLLLSSCALNPSLKKGEFRQDTGIPITRLVVLEEVTYREVPTVRGISSIQWEPMNIEERKKVGYTQGYWLYAFECDEDGIFLEREIRGLFNEPFTTLYYNSGFKMPEFKAENIDFVGFAFYNDVSFANGTYFSEIDDKDIIGILFNEPQKVDYVEAKKENKYNSIGWLCFRNNDLIGIHAALPVHIIGNNYWLETADYDYYIELSQKTLGNIIGKDMPTPQEYWELTYEEIGELFK